MIPKDSAPMADLDFAAALRQERQHAGLTLEQLGLRVGVPGQRVSQLEQGANPPAPDLVFRLEAALGLPPGRLSAHLGYVPVGQVPDVLTALAVDPRLDDVARGAVRSVYDAVAKKAE